MDISLEYVQGWVWQWEELAWRLFGWQSSRRFEAKNNWTCKFRFRAKLYWNWKLYLFSVVSSFDLLRVSYVTCLLLFQNILVVSRYYSRITVKRLAELLCLSIQVCLCYYLFVCTSLIASNLMTSLCGFLCYVHVCVWLCMLLFVLCQDGASINNIWPFIIMVKWILSIQVDIFPSNLNLDWVSFLSH